MAQSRQTANMLNLEELAQIAQDHAQANVPEDEDS